MSINSPIIKNFEKFINRLEEILDLEKTIIIRDAAIKRFELCFDLSWKSVKVYAKKEGIECASPRSCFKTAFQLKLIDYNDQWLAMIDDRNLSAHLYSEEHADQIYDNLPDYLELFKKLFSKFKN